jgi:hypothetical protein
MSGAGNGFGLKCPKCGNTDRLDVECRVYVTVTGDRVRDPYQRSNMAWEPFSGWQWESGDGAHCSKCHHHGTVADFTEPENTA